MTSDQRYPTCAELTAILGPGWAICRKTPRNMERYTNCITRKQYQLACEQALEDRDSKVRGA